MCYDVAFYSFPLWFYYAEDHGHAHYRDGDEACLSIILLTYHNNFHWKLSDHDVYDLVNQDL